jgi:uncharacterized lipoprotein YddW (UPF0748 family)
VEFGHGTRELGVPDNAWNWDFFGAFVAEAKKRKMEVHAWFCVFPESSLLGQVLVNSPKRIWIKNPL